MATTYPPDGLEVFTGVWGTDADQDLVLANLIGPSCVNLKNTLVGTGLKHKKSIPVEAGRPYRVRALVQADSIAGPDSVAVGVLTYDVDDNVVGNQLIHNAVLPGANAWYELSGVVTPAAAIRGYRGFVQKVGTAFNVYIDYLAVVEMPVCFHAYQSITQGVPTGNWTKVEYDTEVYDYGSVYDAANYIFTAPSGGIYAICAATGTVGLAAGDSDGLALFKDTGAGPALWLRGGWNRMQVQTFTTLLPINAPAAYLNRGDTVEVRLWHGFGANRDTRSGNVDTYFMVAKVE